MDVFSKMKFLQVYIFRSVRKQLAGQKAHGKNYRWRKNSFTSKYISDDRFLLVDSFFFIVFVKHDTHRRDYLYSHCSIFFIFYFLFCQNCSLNLPTTYNYLLLVFHRYHGNGKEYSFFFFTTINLQEVSFSVRLRGLGYIIYNS